MRPFQLVTVSVIVLAWIQVSASHLHQTDPDAQARLETVVKFLTGKNTGPKNAVEIYYQGKNPSGGGVCLATIDLNDKHLGLSVNPTLNTIDQSYFRIGVAGYPTNFEEANPKITSGGNTINLKYSYFATDKRNQYDMELAFLRGSSFGLKNLKSVYLSGNSKEYDPKRTNAVKVVHVCENLEPLAAITNSEFQNLAEQTALLYSHGKRHSTSSEVSCDLMSPTKVSCDIELETDDRMGGSDMLHVDYEIKLGKFGKILKIDFEAEH
jgi:hypothetical protein